MTENKWRCAWRLTQKCNLYLVKTASKRWSNSYTRNIDVLEFINSARYLFVDLRRQLQSSRDVTSCHRCMTGSPIFKKHIFVANQWHSCNRRPANSKLTIKFETSVSSEYKLGICLDSEVSDICKMYYSSKSIQFSCWWCLKTPIIY